MDSWVMIIVAYLAVAAIIIYGIVAVSGAFLRSKKKHSGGINDWNWYLQVALSRNDALSQWFLVLGGLALANMIFAVNNNFDGPLSWRTILFFAVLIFAAVAYLGKSVYAAAIAIIGFLVWWTAQATDWQGGVYIIAAIPAGLMWLAIVLYVAGFWQMRYAPLKRFAVAYLGIGLALMNFLLFVFSTRFGLVALEKMNSALGSRIFDSEQNLISVFVIGVLAVVAVAYGWFKKIIFEKEMIAAAVLFLLFGAVAILPGQEMVAGNDLAPAGLVWAMVFNFALFVEILGVIFSGYWRREVWMVNFGALLLIIFVALKYFDWFFSFMNKSAFFIFAGILLFGVGWAMERGRRYLAESIKSKVNQ